MTLSLLHFTFYIALNSNMKDGPSNLNANANEFIITND